MSRVYLPGSAEFTNQRAASPYHGFSGGWLVLLLALFLTACTENTTGKSVETLRVAVLPDQQEHLLREKFQPLLDYLQARAGMKLELHIPQSYEHLLDLFNTGQIDMARFGAATYAKARLQSGAVPVVMRDVDKRFYSVALVSGDHPARSLMDLRGKSLSFGSRLSTSGHLMPRYFFEKKGILPEEFFSYVTYSGAHDRTVELVSRGEVDVGVVNEKIVSEMSRDGRLGAGRARVIWRSPPYADYVWAMQPDISAEQRLTMRDLFISLNLDEEGRQILKNLSANYYIPAVAEDFIRIEEIIRKLEPALAGH